MTGSRRYHVATVIDRGGMGRVDLAVRHDGSFRRVFALKRLHRGMSDDEATRAMFRAEARIAGLLSHPNVVAVVDAGEDEDGLFLVMDFVEGISVQKLLGAMLARGELIPIRAALELATQVARGLHAAHELVDHDGALVGCIHRDVSPQNILIGFEGTARLTDFGIAKMRDGTPGTTAGIVKGKVGYMSPEQLRYEPLDPRSDLFSLGVVLYEVLTVRRLYGAPSGDVAEAAWRILNEPVPDLDDARADVPPALLDLVSRMLAKERGARPSSALEVAEKLEGITASLEPDEPGDEGLRALLERVAGDEKVRVRELLRGAASVGGAGLTSGGRRSGGRAVVAIGLGLGLCLAIAFAVAGGSVLAGGGSPASTAPSAAVPGAVSSPSASDLGDAERAEDAERAGEVPGGDDAITGDRGEGAGAGVDAAGERASDERTGEERASEEHSGARARSTSRRARGASSRRSRGARDARDQRDESLMGWE